MLPTFPNPVDETVARVTAAEVVVRNVVVLAAGRFWLLPLVAADYVVPRAAAMVLAPRLGFRPHLVAGPPKRFAATIVGGIMLLFPALESFAGVCVGCKIFALLMKVGVIPQEVCAACADFGSRITDSPAEST